MFNKAFLLTIFLMMTSAVPAIAAPACQMIDKVLGTFSLVRDIQIDQNDKHYAENMSKLAALVEQISLPALVPPQSLDELSAESAALFHYISSLRTAVASAKSGYDDHAKQTLNTGITKAFTASIQSLAYYWNCMPEQPAPDIQKVSVAEARSAPNKPLYLGAADTSVKPVRGERVKPLMEKPGIRNRLADNRPTDSRLAGRVKFGLVTPVSNTSLLLAFMVFFVQFGTLYIVHKRARNYKVRDARCFVHMVSKMRMGKSVHGIIIVDISMNGAKIQHRKLIKKQKKLQIELGGIWYPGQIQWSNQRFAGVKFDRPIGAQVFNTVLQSPGSSIAAPTNTETLTSS